VSSYSRLAEQRLQQAQRKGELDQLPGEGLPLKIDADGAVPASLRLAYKILKNNGMVPREVSLLRHIDEARLRLEEAPVHQHDAALAELEALCLEYNTLRGRAASLEASSIQEK